MKSIQDALNQAIAPLQKRVFDLNIDLVGTYAKTMLLNIEEDMYGDEELEIRDRGTIYVSLTFPGNELPISWTEPNEDDPESNSLVNGSLHMYDLLPITARVKFSDSNAKSKIRMKDIFLYKIKISDDNFLVFPFQFIERIGLTTLSDVVQIDYNIAPVTNIEITNNSTFQALVNEVKTQDNW